MRRLLMILCLPLALAACGAEPRWSTDEAVAKAHYVHPGPPELTLFTVVNKKNGGGAHTALMVNASERVIFDPAGSWYLAALAERNDVHFGMTDRMVAFYIDYHARETFNVIEQRLVVSPEVAARAMALVKGYGAVPKAHCAQSVSSILRQLPGLESLPATFSPTKLSAAFGAKPGVRGRTITDDDDDNNHGVMILQMNDPRVLKVLEENAALDLRNAAAADSQLAAQNAGAAETSPAQ